jgi:hypothetical protein
MIIAICVNHKHNLYMSYIFDTILIGIYFCVIYFENMYINRKENLK